jgi:hypothetical protein
MEMSSYDGPGSHYTFADEERFDPDRSVDRKFPSTKNSEDKKKVSSSFVKYILSHRCLSDLIVRVQRSLACAHFVSRR